MHRIIQEVQWSAARTADIENIADLTEARLASVRKAVAAIAADAAASGFEKAAARLRQAAARQLDQQELAAMGGEGAHRRVGVAELMLGRVSAAALQVTTELDAELESAYWAQLEGGASRAEAGQWLTEQPAQRIVSMIRRAIG